MRIRTSEVISYISRDAFVAFFALLIILPGLGWASDPKLFAPMVAIQTLNLGLIRTMGLMLLIGGALLLVGMVSLQKRIEQAGLAFIIPSIVIYLYVLFATGDLTHRLFPITLYVTFTAASVVRFRWLGRQAKAQVLAVRVAAEEE